MENRAVLSCTSTTALKESTGLCAPIIRSRSTWERTNWSRSISWWIWWPKSPVNASLSGTISSNLRAYGVGTATTPSSAKCWGGSRASPWVKGWCPPTAGSSRSFRRQDASPNSPDRQELDQMPRCRRRATSVPFDELLPRRPCRRLLQKRGHGVSERGIEDGLVRGTVDVQAAVIGVAVRCPFPLQDALLL